MTTPPYSCDGNAVTVTVRVSPKASRSAVIGAVALSDGTTALAVRIAAPPVDGAANAELVRVVAKAPGIARGAVTLAGGATSRMKRLRIDGDPAAIAAAFDRLTAG